ncbi:hypothetical protein C4579_02420 [Candidatus Microgenomates bacterium]|nr:MAG: hypothetical protein C4579_02420 [Candidatus Microgenomates bacterium]
MHHTATRLELEAVKKSQNLNELHIIFGLNVEDAIRSRHELITGNGRFPRLNIRIGKGEVPLEFAVNMRIHGSFGAGHELDNIVAGVEENRGLNLVTMSPRCWLPAIRADWEQNKDLKVRQSITVLAPAFALQQFGQRLMF